MITKAREMINTSYDEALKQLKALNKVAKNNQKILYLIGRCYQYKGNKEKAKKYYEKAIEIQAGTEEAVQADKYLSELNGTAKKKTKKRNENTGDNGDTGDTGDTGEGDTQE